MEIIRSTVLIRATLNRVRGEGKSIGFVPTMGALHAGHFSLINQSVNDNDLTVCSIFVNPTQFNNASDLANYPDTMEQDLAQLESLQCDVVFIPDAKEMYPSKPQLKFNFGLLEEVMEGLHRPGHFNGVALVVSKLFHIVSPDIAYFGQKDIQQFALISRLVKDLSFQIELVCCPTLRETDGLAMSSRNLLIRPEHRSLAPTVYNVLEQAKEKMLKADFTIDKVLKEGEDVFQSHPEFNLEYLKIVDFETLAPLDSYQKGQKCAICVSAFLGEVRLIDNVIFE